MGLIPNTTRRGAIYHFRRAVPTRLQPFLDRSELICSLGTSDPKVARALSRRAYLRSEDLFEALVAREMLTEDDISALVRDFYETVLARDSAVRLMRDKPLSESERQHRSDYYRELAENSRLDLAKSAFGSVRLTEPSTTCIMLVIAPSPGRGHSKGMGRLRSSTCGLAKLFTARSISRPAGTSRCLSAWPPNPFSSWVSV